VEESLFGRSGLYRDEREGLIANMRSDEEC